MSAAQSFHDKERERPKEQWDHAERLQGYPSQLLFGSFIPYDNGEALHGLRALIAMPRDLLREEA